MNFRQMVTNPGVIKWGSVSVIVAVVTVLLYGVFPVVKIGANSTTYTYSDLAATRRVLNQINRAYGWPVLSWKQVFQMLMLTGMEREILAAKGVTVSPEQATAFVDASIGLKGVMKAAKEDLGDERYYKSVIEPMAVDRAFRDYYVARDPNREIARKVLAEVQQFGLAGAAEKSKRKVVAIQIQRTPADSRLYDAAANAIGSVIPQVVEAPEGYLVVAPRSQQGEVIQADVIAIERQPFGEFVRNELKTGAVPVSYRFHSLFRAGSLEDAGGVFHVAAKADDGAKGK